MAPRSNKIDLGEVWTRMTGLPFVYAFWAGRPDVLTADDVAALQRARDDGIGAYRGHRGGLFQRSAAPGDWRPLPAG